MSKISQFQATTKNILPYSNSRTKSGPARSQR